MKPNLRAFSIDFRADGGIVFPVNPTLHKMALEYAEKQLAKQFNFTDVKKLVVICAIDDEGNPTAIHAMGAIVFKPVIPIFRATEPEAGDMMIERLRAYLEDNGWKGAEALIFLEPREPKEAKCPKWKRLLRLAGARKVSHWGVTV